MYRKSLIVFVLCTVFVLSFVIVLNYATSGVGKEGQLVTTTGTQCVSNSTSCERFSITSVSLRTVNYTDELGTVNYASIVLGLNTSGSSPLTSVSLFIGNSTAGTIQGPFAPGVNRVVNITLPATVSVSPGKAYVVNIEGFYGGGLAVWETVRVTAQ